MEERILTIPNALSFLRLLLVPVFLWLVLGPEHDEAAIGPALIAYARLGYAEALRQNGRIDAAEPEYLNALEKIETAIGDVDALTTGQALVVVGNFYVDTGRFEQARAYLDKARTLLGTVAEQQEKGLDALRGLGIIHYANGELEAVEDRALFDVDFGVTE